MCVPPAETDACLQWLQKKHGREFAVEKGFPLSSKIYSSYIIGDEARYITSYATICPGACGEVQGACWTIDNACQHTLEASYSFKYEHRWPEDEFQPVMLVVFDASANHKARAQDALHVRSLCGRAGGVNAPVGAPLRHEKAERRPKMRDGRYVDAKGVRHVLPIHRNNEWTDDKTNKPAIFNANGSICKGMEETLIESGRQGVRTLGENKCTFQPSSKTYVPGRWC